MSHRTRVISWISLSTLLAAGLYANNVFVLPSFVNSATATGIIYNSNLQSAGTFTSATDATMVLARPTTTPADVKYYVISPAGSNSVVILNAAFQQIGQPISFGQNVRAAAVTPDGRRLIAIAGNVNMFNTANDERIQVQQNLDVGPDPRDLAISHDSTRAFVLSTVGQRVTAIDLTTNAVIGTIPLPGLAGDRGFLAMGPNGMLYISRDNLLLEVNPALATFSSASIRRQFPLQGADLGRLHFTPDGTRAFAINRAFQTGQLVYYFQVDHVASGVAALSAAEANLTGFQFSEVFVAGNDLAYFLVGNSSASNRGKLYVATLPPVTASGSTVTFPAVQEAFFGSLGSIPVAASMSFSTEYPRAERAFINAPLNTIAPAAQNTVYAATLGGSTPSPTVTATQAVTFLPSAVQYAGPSTTNVDTPVSAGVRMGMPQPLLAAGGTTLPFGVRVVSATGRPMFNVPVTFTTTFPGVVINGVATVLTNKDGIAFTTATAPGTAGDFQINAAVGGSALVTSFTFTAGATTGGGGGGGGTGGGGTGATQILILDGDGMVTREGNFPQVDPATNKPRTLKIRVLDATGKPVPAGTQVGWTISQGGGRWSEGTFTNETTISTVTDAFGETANSFVGAVLSLGNSFNQSVGTITALGATATVYLTTVLDISGGAFAPYPSANLLAPTSESGLPSLIGKAGQTITGAIQAQYIIATGPQLGAVLTNVGLSASTGNDPRTGPTVTCTPKPVALSNEQGLAVCDLRLSGRAGSGVITVNLGGFSERKINLRVDAGDPSELKVINGNNQSGDINQVLPATLIVELGDGGGNTLAGANVRWEVVQGTATLANSITVTDTNGRASNILRLGTGPGLVLIRATAVGGQQPSVTFEARVNVTVADLTRVSGDGQTTFTNTSFAQPLVVRVTDTRSLPVPGQTVSYVIASGSAVLSSSTQVTDANGFASVTARAGANAGPIVVNATVQGLSGRSVTFNLNSQLPGPVINSLDFYNAASNERGAIVPGGLYTIAGTGIAPDLRGCIEGVAIIGMLPTRVNGVEVQFGSNLAPVLSVCNVSGRETVTVQVPFELAAGGEVAVTVRVGGGSSVINGVRVVDLQPGVFETTDGQGRRYAVALRPNGSFVTPENPARYGEIIRAFITGAGQANPLAQTGVTGFAGQSLVAPTVVGINDSGARLVSATYAIGVVGIYEIAVEITAGTATGPARPLGILLARPNGSLVFPGNAPNISIAP